MAKITKATKVKEVKKDKHLETGAAPELHPEFNVDHPTKKQRHLIR